MSEWVVVVFFAIIAFIVTSFQVFFGSLFPCAVLVALWQVCTIGPDSMTFGLFVMSVVKFTGWVTDIVMTIITLAFLTGRRIC